MAQVVPHKLRMTPVDELKPHPKNARKHADAAIDESIATNGFYRPVVASSASGYILAGHGTWERACAAALTELPVYWLDGLDSAAELRIIAADNKTSDLSPGFDEKMLAELLDSVRHETGGLEGTGYTQDTFDKLIEDLAGEVLREARERVEDIRKLKKGEDSEAAPQLGGLEYRIVITCQNEQHQTELLEKFEADGYDCKALIS